jgi:PIN domain nuclease of toxin-antitoxin system
LAGGIPVILLDTCALLALQETPPVFSRDVCRMLEAPSSRVFVSAISAFEIGQKSAAGKLALPVPLTVWFVEMLRSHHLEELPLDSATCAAATSLPPIHKDPFDRLVTATALRKNLVILTRDETIPKYPGVTTLW